MLGTVLEQPSMNFFSMVVSVIMEAARAIRSTRSWRARASLAQMARTM